MFLKGSDFVFSYCSDVVFVMMDLKALLTTSSLSSLHYTKMGSLHNFNLDDHLLYAVTDWMNKKRVCVVLGALTNYSLSVLVFL